MCFLVLTNNSIHTPGDLSERLARIHAHSESTMMVGDRMDTDALAGIVGGLDTILVLTGSTRANHVDRVTFQPGRILDSIADAIELLGRE